MNAIRLLAALVAYSVVILEVYSGVINGPPWWIIPGGLFIALLISISMLPQAGGAQTNGPSPFQWILILAIAFAMSGFAWYFGHDMVPGLLEQRLT